LVLKNVPAYVNRGFEYRGCEICDGRGKELRGGVRTYTAGDGDQCDRNDGPVRWEECYTCSGTGKERWWLREDLKRGYQHWIKDARGDQAPPVGKIIYEQDYVDAE
jgi:hypothetical protein